MTAYYAYGARHGTALLIDASKPDRDKFLAFMENRLPEKGLSDYMDGVMDGLLGDGQRKYRYLRGLAKVGSDDE